MAAWQKYRDSLEQHFNPRVAFPFIVDYQSLRGFQSAAARSRMNGEYDVRYGESPRETMDVFHPAKADDCVLIFVHGGYWRSGSKDQYSFVAEPFVSAGIPCFLLNYELCPAAPLAKVVERVSEGIRWISTNACRWGYSSRIFLFGHSAGAHLCALALREPAVSVELAGAALCSGVYDLEPVRNMSVGQDLGIDEAAVVGFSPLTAPPRTSAPILLSVGGLEPAGWRDQTFDFADVCRSAGCRVELFDLAGEHHSSLLHRHANADYAPTRRMIEIMTS